ncbi:hypothetical protein [Oceaniovalibus sp. ACAM 378]|nr:hypothetical protein [Oceaniovalibus sp. ACAM 378]
MTHWWVPGGLSVLQARYPLNPMGAGALDAIAFRGCIFCGPVFAGVEEFR